MSFFSNFFNVKESPILSLTGFGGGGTGISLGGAAGAASGPFTVTGGDQVLTPGNGNKYHVFVSSGSLVVAPGPGMNGTINALILAGGGSGGKSGPSYAGSAGAGGGGAVYLSSYQIYGASGGPVSYPVTVGPGAAAQTSDEQRGTNGSDSVIDFSPFALGPAQAQIALTAKGGGGGATSGSGTPGSALAGGNGGGGALLRFTEMLDTLARPFMDLVVVDQDVVERVKLPRLMELTLVVMVAMVWHSQLILVPLLVLVSLLQQELTFKTTLDLLDYMAVAVEALTIE